MRQTKLRGVKYEQIRERKSAEFQRLTGVAPVVFASMVKCLQEQIRVFGRPCKLSLEDRLLLTLMYWREYRTMAAVALTYEVSEPTVHRTINRVEKAFLACGEWSLPGKKALQDPEMEYQVVIIDATQTPVERPKKNSAKATAARKSATRAKRNCS